jgi:hypothetical protein
VIFQNQEEVISSPQDTLITEVANVEAAFNSTDINNSLLKAVKVSKSSEVENVSLITNRFSSMVDQLTDVIMQFPKTQRKGKIMIILIFLFYYLENLIDAKSFIFKN